MSFEIAKVNRNMLKALRMIPVYPESIRMATLCKVVGCAGQLPTYAPICEDDNNKLSFVSAQQKRDYILAVQRKGVRNSRAVEDFSIAERGVTQ